MLSLLIWRHRHYSLLHIRVRSIHILWAIVEGKVRIFFLTVLEGIVAHGMVGRGWTEQDRLGLNIALQLQS